MNNYIKIGSIFILVLVILLGNRNLTTRSVQWNKNIKGELFTAQFYKDSNLILTGVFGLKCLDIEDGEIKWADKKDSLVFSLNKPSLNNGKLFTGTDRSKEIYNIDISTGKYLNKYDINGIALLTKVTNNQLYFILRENGYSKYKLNMINLDTKDIKSIYEFKDDVHFIRDPLIIYKDYILVSTLQENERNILYCINKSSGNLYWKIELPQTGVRLKNIIHYKDSIFWVDVSKNMLFEKNIKTESTSVLQLENISRPYLSFDGKNILIHGKMNNKGNKYSYNQQLYLYNVYDRKIKLIEVNYNEAILINEKVIYEYGNKIFCYNIYDDKKRQIYSFNEEMVDIYASEQYILLILAKDIREVHNGNASGKYVLLSLLE